MTSFRVVIPARYDSVRLPGKALLMLAGKPMLQWVHERACASQASEVWVATDDERIEKAAQGFGAQVVLTRREHVSGTDRIAEVARLRAWPADAIVVNVQGDEPLIPPAAIDQVAQLLASDPHAGLATLAAPLRSSRDLVDPNVVKVVADKDGRALYFSRAPIPCDRDAALPARLTQDRDSAASQNGHKLSSDLLAVARRHIGIYAYRVAALARLSTTVPTPLESLERLEQLRALESGLLLRVADAVALSPMDVNTADDARAAATMLRSRER